MYFSIAVSIIMTVCAIKIQVLRFFCFCSKVLNPKITASDITNNSNCIIVINKRNFSILIDWFCLFYQEGEQVYNNCDNRNDEHKENPPHRTDSNGFWSLEEFLQNVLWKQEGVFQKKSFGRYGHERQFPAECSDGGGF